MKISRLFWVAVCSLAAASHSISADDPAPPVSNPAPEVVEPEPPVSNPAPEIAEPEPPVSKPAPEVAEPEPPVSKPNSAVSETVSPDPHRHVPLRDEQPTSVPPEPQKEPSPYRHLWEQPEPSPPPLRSRTGNTFRDVYEIYLRKKLGVGIRSRNPRLDEQERPKEHSFMGTIVRLDLEDPGPVQPYLLYDVTPYFRLEFCMESLETHTWTYTGHSDGAFEFNGPSLLVLLRYPNPWHVTPGVGLGLIWYAAEFNANPQWANGFQFDESGQRAYNRWRAEGSPPYPNNGYNRHFETSHRSSSVVLCATVDVVLGDRVEIGAYIKQVELSTRGHYTLRSYERVFDDHGWFDFPHDYTQAGVQLSCRF